MQNFDEFYARLNEEQRRAVEHVDAVNYFDSHYSEGFFVPDGI
jgi:hypothetical protein